MEDFGRDLGRLLSCMVLALCIVLGLCIGLVVAWWIKS